MFLCENENGIQNPTRWFHPIMFVVYKVYNLH